MPRDISPAGSIRSIASSTSGTLSRPPPPPKPSHLSSAFTGTCNSIALRDYIQAQKTGGSFSSETPFATVSKAHLGYGYVDTFDSSSSEDEGCQDNSDAVGTTRPSARGRTYTAPSVSRIFSPSKDQDAGDGTTRLIRNEPIAIDGSGPSRVGNLRNLFESAGPSSPPVQSSLQNSMFSSKSDAGLLSKQNTGLNPKPKPRISNQVRMLQAQITGDQYNSGGTWNLPRLQNNMSSHSRQPTEQSITSQDDDDQSIYGTASQDLLGEALKMDAIVTPPVPESLCQRSVPVSAPASSDASNDASNNTATISRSSSNAAFFSPRKNSNLVEHDRDDSTATIRPLHPQQPSQATLSTSTARLISPRSASGSRNKSRLSSIFTSSPDSSLGGAASLMADTAGSFNVSPSPSAGSITHQAMLSETDSQTDPDDSCERSREPSMLVPDDSLRSSRHLRANDGSCFDLDWGTHVSPTKASLKEEQGRNGLSMHHKAEEAVVDADAKRDPSALAEPVVAMAESSPRRPDSVVDQLEFQAFSANISTSTPPAESEASHHTKQDAERISTIRPADLLFPAQSPEAARPASARLLQPGLGKLARALYDFEGETAFNELSIRAGQSFDVINEQLAGGWSLGVVWDENGVPRRGLIPQGWYCYIQDFTMSPAPSRGIEPPPTPSPIDQEQTATFEANSVSVPAIRLSSAPPGGQDCEPIANGSRMATRNSAVTVKSNGSSHSPAAERSSAEHASRSPTLSPQTKSSYANSVRNDFSAGPEGTDRDISVSGQESAQPHGADRMDNAVEQVIPIIDGMPVRSSSSAPMEWRYGAEDPTQQHQEAHSLPDAAGSSVNGAESSSDWKGSIFGKKTFNRFASFVTSGAEDYVLSNTDLSENERKRTNARKVSGGNTSVAQPPALTEVSEEAEEQDVAVSASQLSLAPSHLHSEALDEDPDQHFVVAGPAGPKWKSKTPTFLVQVHHPEKRSKMNGMQEYTIYHVTSTFPAVSHPDEERRTNSIAQYFEGRIPYDPLGGPHPPGSQLTVLRRFTQFEWLYQVLVKHYSALLIPPLPEKQYSGRFASEFIETRRADLEMWISRIVRHPILRYSDPVQFFLSCEDELEWRTGAARMLRGDSKKAKGGVFARTWHPDFNFDSTEAAVEAESMEAYLKALEKTINGVGGHNVGKHGVLGAYKAHREGNLSTSTIYRDLSYTLLRMLTGAGAAENEASSAAAVQDTWAHHVHGPPMGNLGKRSESGATNEHGAWCWREECHDCINLTSALQNTAETLQDVADLYEQHGRDTLLRQHERIKEVSRPHASVQSLLDTHRTTLAKYREATGEPDPLADDDDTGDEGQGEKPSLPPQEAEKLASRCETVLNVTLSEMDRLHDERVQDWHALGRSFLDSEIELYENVLENLKAARAHYDEQYYDRDQGIHILSSRYQPDLGRPKKPLHPLQMPSAAQVPGAGLGVGMLLSQATGGVIRPASVGIDSLYELPSAATSGGGGAGGSRFMTSFLLTRNRSSGSGSTSISSAYGGNLPKTPQSGPHHPYAQEHPSSPNKEQAMDYLSDTTNFAHASNLASPGKTYSQAGATLKAISHQQQQQQQQQQSSRNSYFPSIWR